MPGLLRSREWSLVGPGTVAVGARSFGPLAADRVRLQFVFCGLCGSDVSKYRARGKHAPNYPLSIGHEFVARVTEIGEKVTGWSVGEAVTSDLNYRCSTCAHCTARRSHLCVDGAVGRFTNRGFADYADFDPSYLNRLDGVKAHFALTEPLSCVLHARDWGLAESVDRILVVGAGGIGLCLGFALAHTAEVDGFHLIDRIASRRSLLAAAVGDRCQPVTAPVGEYDLVFDVSGTASGLELACGAVARGGRLCSMSHLDGADASFLLPALTRRDVTFKVSYLNGEQANITRAASLLADHFDARWAATLGLVPFAGVADSYSGRDDDPHCKTIIEIG